jgi:hypothetical protein
MASDVVPGRRLAGRDWIAAGATVVLLVALIGGGVWLHARQVALAEAKARDAAAAEAAQPKRAPPITTSVYVRAVPVRHAQ